MKYRQENRFTGSYLYICGEDKDDEESEYDVTGQMSMQKAFAQRKCSYEVLYELVKTLSDEGRRLESQKKDLCGWILDPECIYITLPGWNNQNMNKLDYHNQSRQEIDVRFFYYLSGDSTPIEAKLLTLAEFVIRHVDYKDKDAVNFAYEFYMRVYRGNFVFNDML